MSNRVIVFYSCGIDLGPELAAMSSHNLTCFAFSECKRIAGRKWGANVDFVTTIADELIARGRDLEAQS